MRIVVSCILSAVIGLVALPLLWDFFYGIGSSVISDEMYYEWTSRMPLCGFLVGLASGALTGGIAPRMGWLVVAVQHIVPFLAAALVTSYHASWKVGLVTYVVGQFVVSIAGATLPRRDRKLKIEKPSTAL
jgi:hypothetical protein